MGNDIAVPISRPLRLKGSARAYEAEPASKPPSTGNDAPVIQPAAGEQRKTAARPMSSGVPTRCSGTLSRRELVIEPVAGGGVLKT